MRPAGTVSSGRGKHVANTSIFWNCPLLLFVIDKWKMNEELLISLVSQYKELYDTGDTRYHDEQRRNNIWQEIGEIMKLTGKYFQNIILLVFVVNTK